MTDQAAFLSEAAALLGPRGLTGDAELIAPWLTDWRGRYSGKACALASPADAQELAALVKLCGICPGIQTAYWGGTINMAFSTSQVIAPPSARISCPLR